MAGDIKKLWGLCEQDVENCGESRDKQGSGQTPRVTGTGAGRPGNTPDPCIPDPCIPDPCYPPCYIRRWLCLFFTVQLSRLHHTHHTPSLARTTAMKAHKGPQQPTKADEEGKGSPRRGKRAQTTRLASSGP